MNAPETFDYGSAHAYAEVVRKWMQDTQSFRVIQHGAMLNAFVHAVQNHAQSTNQPNRPANVHHRQTVQVDADGTRRVVSRYRIPSYLRRFIAEMIDFIFSFIVKLFVIYSLVVFEIIDLDRYEKLLDQQTDLQMLIDVTQDLFPLEILGKLVCSFAEASFISFGFFSMNPGQTPGKMFMGIQVVSCDQVLPIVGDRSTIDVSGLVRVPFKNSLLRSLVKNLIVNSLVPLSTVAYAFNYNRAIYDIFAKTIVVFKE